MGHDARRSSASENGASVARAGGSRRAFLSASAIAAAGIPLLGGAGSAAASTLAPPEPDPGPRDMLRPGHPPRMEATVQEPVSFRTPHTSSRQTDPVPRPP